MTFLIFLCLAVLLIFITHYNKRLEKFYREYTNSLFELNKKMSQLEKILHELKQRPADSNFSATEAPTAPSAPTVEDVKFSSPQTQPILTKVIVEQENIKENIFSEVKLTSPKTEEPGPLNQLFSKIKNYFMTGNTLVKVGVVLIFFGISFLLKYAIDNDILPIELRLIGAAALGLIILKIGWNLREKVRDYGLILQGGGIGVLMLTTFISLKSYSLISNELAFFLLVAFTAATAYLAVYQNSVNLAVFGLFGGFLAPILASSGQGQHLVLFSYYTLLNIGVLYISWKKTWRILNLIGFIFTFGIGTAWGVLKYNPEHFNTVQPFLIIFFLIYAAIPIIFANKQEPELKGYVDGTIVFGNSIISLVLQLQLVKGIEHAGAFSALSFSAFYIFASRYLLKHKNTNFRLLAEAFISIGIVFITVAIPLAFDGLKTSAIWAAEAAGIYWVALKQGRTFARRFSTFLMFATSVSFFLSPARGTSTYVFLNTYFFSCLLMAGGSYFISYLRQKNVEKFLDRDSIISYLLFAIGSMWWILGGLYELDRAHYTSPNWGELANSYEWLTNAKLFYLGLGTGLIYFIAHKLDWNKLRFLAHSFVLAMFVIFLYSLDQYSHPFDHFGSIAWIFSFAVYYAVLYNNDKLFSGKQILPLDLGHVLALTVLVGVIAQEFKWLTNTFVGESSSWRYAAQAIAPTLTIWLIVEKKELFKWPVLKNYTLYFKYGLAPIIFISWLWLMITNWTSDGNAAPLPYFPIVNPLELSHLWVLFAITIWIRRLIAENMISKKSGGIALGASYFIWLNGVLCRFVHHFFDVPFYIDSLYNSVIVQVAFSLYWTVLGIVLMIWASRKLMRWLWLTGAGLLAVVVLKMFLIDLSKTNTIARVISFIGVGILFLIVGYFSPIPPKKVETDKHA